MKDYSNSHFVLPDQLRSELGKPMGELIEGTIDQTIPVLKKKLVPHDYYLVAVGDVTANLFVEHGFDPNIIVTDGQTKRQKLDDWKDWTGYEVLEANCPAAEITPEAWKILQKAINVLLSDQSSKIHVKIFGEEDLLVLPLLIELPIGSKIVYGQPNKGAVIRSVDKESKQNATQIIEKMDIKNN